MPGTDLVPQGNNSISTGGARKLLESLGVDSSTFDPNMLYQGESLLFHLTRANEGMVEHRMADQDPNCPFDEYYVFEEARRDPEVFINQFWSRSGLYEGQSFAQMLKSFVEEWQAFHEYDSFKDYLMKRVGLFEMTQQHAAMFSLLLIDLGADPNYVSPQRGRSVLSESLNFFNFRLAKTLYLAGADVVTPKSNALLYISERVRQRHTTLPQVFDFIDTVAQYEGSQVFVREAPQADDPEVSSTTNGKCSWLHTRMLHGSGGYVLSDVDQYIFDKYIFDKYIAQSLSPPPQIEASDDLSLLENVPRDEKS